MCINNGGDLVTLIEYLISKVCWLVRLCSAPDYACHYSILTCFFILFKIVFLQGAKPVKNGSGNSPLHSEAMHCETSSAWPTAAASTLLTAFPDLEMDVNKNGLTAQQTFDQDIDAEEPAVGKSDHITQSSEKKTKRDQFGAAEEFLDNAAAARAGKKLFYLLFLWRVNHV